jgi:hypothetical protein
MNVLLWILQVLLALHTAMGAVWKITNSEQTVPSLQAIPHGVWMALIGLELLCALGLILPAFNKPLNFLIPLSAACIGTVMLVYVAVHIASGDPSKGPMVYWLVVATVCAFLAYGRLKLKPL